jgi:hypothetical protein
MGISGGAGEGSGDADLLPPVTPDVVEAVALHHGVCIRPVPGSLDPDADLPCQQGREEAPTLITDTLDSPAPFRDDRWRVKVGQFEVDDKVPS